MPVDDQVVLAAGHGPADRRWSGGERRPCCPRCGYGDGSGTASLSNRMDPGIQ